MHPPRPLQIHYCVGIYTIGNQVGNSESLARSSPRPSTARDIRDQREDIGIVTVSTLTFLCES